MEPLKTQKTQGAAKHLLFSTAVAMLLLPFSLTSAFAQAQAEQALGEVQFDISCNATASAAFQRGLTLLHHMMYEQSKVVFAAAAEQSPECAMLHWGEAMTYFHPLWPGQPAAEAIEAGRTAVAKMRGNDNVSAAETALIDAAAAFYEADEAGYRDRIAAWATAQSAAYESQGDNVDIAALYGLSQLATARRDDPTMAQQQRVGTMLEEINKQQPLHPGIYHYVIHAYDNPALAEQGLPFARAYGEIAPDVPHALHMPSHIFVRQGYWDEAITWNERSAAAALAQPMGELIGSHYAHAMDYLIYSHLQRGEVEIAQALVAEFVGTAKQQSDFGSAYALAAAPVRLLLEQEKWKEAAAIPITLHPAIDWDKFPQCVAIVWFAKGLGAARSGDTATAQIALNELQSLQDEMAAADQPYWMQLTGAQMKAIEAWLALSDGNNDLAFAMLSEAADIEDAAGKSPVTPGHILPIRELLGDMYAQSGEAEMASEAYTQTLALSPNRWRSVSALR